MLSANNAVDCARKQLNFIKTYFITFESPSRIILLKKKKKKKLKPCQSSNTKMSQLLHTPRT